MRPRAPASLLALALLAAPLDAAAWISMDGDASPPHTAWATVPISWSLNQNGSADLGFATTETVVLDSFATWAEPTCTSWNTTYLGSTTRQPNDDGQNVLGWIESGWWYGSGAIGVTSVSFGGGYTIAEADIAFNGQDFGWDTTGGGGWSVDTQSIASHEMGHFLGLGDLYGGECWDDQTMCGVYGGGTGPRTLSSDDIAGVCALYPSGTECLNDDDCPSGEHCDGGICVPDPTGGEPCDPCTTHEDCGGTYDLCLGGFPDGNMYCGRECASPADCPPCYNCTPISGSPVNQCIPVDFDCVTPACATDEDCASGEVCQDCNCVPPPPECTVDEDCPPGEVCRDGTCIPDPSPHLPMCSVCTTHEDCGGPDDLCLGGFVDGTTRCGVSCASVGGSCGTNNVCFDFPDPAVPDQCVPSDMDCTPDCSTDVDCPPGERCVGGYCTNLCDPSEAAPCPAGYYCHFTQCGQGVCEPAPDGPGLLGLGERCSSDLDCQTLWCQPALGGSFCTLPCDYLLGGSTCPSPTACQPLERGACGVCSCSAGKLGDPCTGNSQCQAGQCVIADGAGICTFDCAAGGTACSAGFTCRPPVDGAPEACLPALLAMGRPCSMNEECADGLCLPAGVTNVCTRACAATGCSCPIGFACRTFEGFSACVPSSIVMTSGCGCTMAGTGPEAPLLLVSVFLGILLVIRRKFFD